MLRIIAEQTRGLNHLEVWNELQTELEHYDIEMQWRLVHRVWDAPDVLGRLRRRLQRVRHFTDVRNGFDFVSDDSDLSERATDSEMRTVSTETLSEGDHEEEAISILDMMNEQMRQAMPARPPSAPSSPRSRSPSQSP